MGPRILKERTRIGSLGFTLLRLVSPEPMSKEQAYLAIRTPREDTWKGDDELRIDIADKFIVEHIWQSKPKDPSVPDDCPAVGDNTTDGKAVDAEIQAERKPTFR